MPKQQHALARGMNCESSSLVTSMLSRCIVGGWSPGTIVEKSTMKHPLCTYPPPPLLPSFFLLVQGKEMFLDLLDNVRRNTVYSLQMYNPSPKPAAEA